MKIDKLWENLDVKQETKVNLIKDLSEGKVPQLPYFVIGIEEEKERIASQLDLIDGGRMLTNFLIAKYGNGKTNLLKYLELFFENSEEIHVVYKRANVDQPDIGLFLLKEIQDHFTDFLISCIENSRSKFNFSSLTNNFPESFRAIEEYTKALYNKKNSSDEIKRLIYLGTGRLYSKAEFGKFGLEQLSNFERKEVLVLFLNILSENKFFVIFQIDEIEKIYEKSKLRLNSFFTSYREIFDLFSFVKGHYLLCSMTDANADSDFIRAFNEAFYSRIQPHILHLSFISGKENITTLVNNLNDLYESNKTDSEIDKIVQKLIKQKLSQNRELIRQATFLLNENVKLSWSEILNKNNLQELYNQTFTELDYSGLFKNLHQKFFDPLETYLIGANLMENGSEIKNRDYQSFIDNVNNKIHYFILNENIDISLVQYKIDEIIKTFDKELVIYSPIKLELTNDILVPSEHTITIVDYDPIELFVLLNMYRDNFEIQTQMHEIIGRYTNDNL